MKKLALLLLPSLLAAHPSDGQVISGSAQIAKTASECTIRAADKTVINWDRFDINQGESTIFIQPHSNASILNRVTGTFASEIHGHLQANGNVYLINPNGILIGPEGIIQTHQFFASTLDLAGDLFDPDLPARFSGKTGSIVNRGSIQGEDWVVLIAPNISNTGEILASSVAMASSHTVLMHPRTKDHVWIEVADPNTDTPFSGAINLEGTIRASRIANVEGQILLKADLVTIGGQLTSPQGAMEILGQDISIEKTAFLSVSGTERGDSGSIIAKATQSIAFEGVIEAKGGALSGDGGFVEISGKSVLLKGIADRTAPQGKAGMLLIDPSDITISGAPTDINVTFPCAPNTYCITGALPSPANILNTDINAQLALGPVTVTTNSAFGDTGNIVVSEALSWASGFDLTLMADGSISVLAPISNGSTGTTRLTAQDSIFVTDTFVISMGGGDILFNAISGNVELLTTPSNDTGVISAGGLISVNAGQDITLTNAGNPTMSELIMGAFPGGGSTVLNAGRDIVLNNASGAITSNPVAIGGSSMLNATAGRDIILTHPGCFMATATGDLTVIAGRNVSMGLFAAIITVNPAATITIVTDNQAPAAPQVGNGGLLMNPQALIGFVPFGPPNQANVRIYTARPSQNSIGQLNSTPFVHDPNSANTATEVYGVYFPSAIPITSPLQYIVFYKVPDNSVPVVTQQVPQVISSGFEFLRKFAYRQPYSLLNEVEQFWIRYKPGEESLNRTFYPTSMTNYREFTP